VHHQLEAIDQERQGAVDTPARGVIEEGVWFENLRTALQTVAVGLTTTDLRNLTHYLANTGKLLWLNARREFGHPSGETRLVQRPSETTVSEDSGLQSPVVLDQSWLIETVYEIVRPAKRRGSLFSAIESGRGFIPGKALRENSFVSDSEKKGLGGLLLLIMEQCNILVPVVKKNRSEDWKDWTFLATEKALLPAWTAEHKILGEGVEAIRAPASNGFACQGYEFDFPPVKLCEFDFRPILAELGRMFGTRARFWKEGMQVSGRGSLDGRHSSDVFAEFDLQHHATGADQEAREDLATEWILRVRWVPESEESMLGALRAGALIKGPKAAYVAERLAMILARLNKSFSGQSKSLVFRGHEFPEVFDEVAPPTVSTPALAEKALALAIPFYTRTGCPPKVFISYSWDSTEHNEEVLKLSNWLRSQCIDTVLDRYHARIGADWSCWMSEQIEKADYIIIVFTAGYLLKSDTASASAVRNEWRLIEARVDRVKSTAAILLATFEGVEPRLTVHQATRFLWKHDQFAINIRDRIWEVGVQEPAVSKIPDTTLAPPQFGKKTG
jgi:hypothetical protein